MYKIYCMPNFLCTYVGMPFTGVLVSLFYFKFGGLSCCSFFCCIIFIDTVDFTFQKRYDGAAAAKSKPIYFCLSVFFMFCLCYKLTILIFVAIYFSQKEIISEMLRLSCKLCLL